MVGQLKYRKIIQINEDENICMSYIFEKTLENEEGGRGSGNKKRTFRINWVK